MKVDSDLSTVKDHEEWHHFLMNSSKEKLVELILAHMYRDHYFIKEVQSRLIETNESNDELMDTYVTNIKSEMMQSVPNVYFMETQSEKLTDVASETDDLFEKVKLYITVIKCLEESMNNGAGYEGENEFVLDEIMDSCCDEVLENIRNKQTTLTMDERELLYEYMANVSIDGASVWHIEDILKKLQNC